METIFIKTEISKTNEPHKFRLSVSDKFNLKNSSKNAALGNLSIYYTWKNVKSAYKNNKFLIYLMVLILLKTFKTTFNLLSKNMKI